MADQHAEDGWRVWDLTEAGTWPTMWPPLRYRFEDEKRIAIRADAPRQAGNRLGAVHGGFLAGLAEHCLAVFMEAQGRQMGCVTISLALDYPAPAAIGQPLAGTVELVRETGRMQFLRVLIGQGDDVVIHGTGVLRKVPL